MLLKLQFLEYAYWISPLNMQIGVQCEQGC